MVEKLSAYFYSFLPNSPTKKRLYENFLSLSLLRGLSYIFPLITLPYLVRILGPEKYGLVVFAQAFANYFNIITDYGFNMSATREVSINRGNKKKVSQIFSSVITIKLLLFLLSLLVFSLIIISFPRFSGDKQVYFFSLLLVLGNALFPVWLFQGMEKMKYITLINLLAKILFLISIFIFIRNQNQYILVPLLNSLGYIISGLLGLLLASKKFKIKFKKPTLTMAKGQLTKGWYFFISSLSTGIYTVGNVFILGLLTNNELVGYFSGGEKIISSVRSFIGITSQAVYPFFSKLFKDKKERGLLFLKKLGSLMFIFNFFVSLLIFTFASLITKTILGNQFDNSVKIIKIMSFLPVLVSMAHVFSVQGLFALGKSKTASRNFMIASIFHIPVFILLTKWFSIEGSALTMVLTEILLVIISVSSFKKSFKNKKNNANNKSVFWLFIKKKEQLLE